MPEPEAACTCISHNFPHNNNLDYDPLLPLLSSSFPLTQTVQDNRIEFYQKLYPNGLNKKQIDAWVENIIEKLTKLPSTQERAKQAGESPIGIRRQDLVFESIKQFIKSGILEGISIGSINHLIKKFDCLYNLDNSTRSHDRTIAINLLKEFFQAFSCQYALEQECLDKNSSGDGCSELQDRSRWLIYAAQLLERCDLLLYCNSHIEEQQSQLQISAPTNSYQNPLSIAVPGFFRYFRTLLTDTKLQEKVEDLVRKQETLFNEIGYCFAQELLTTFDTYWKTNVACTTDNTNNNQSTTSNSDVPKTIFKGYLTIQLINRDFLKKFFKLSDRVRSRRHLKPSLEELRKSNGRGASGSGKGKSWMQQITHISSWFEHKAKENDSTDILSVKVRIKSFLSAFQKAGRPNRNGYGLILDQFGITVHVNNEDSIFDVLQSIFDHEYRLSEFGQLKLKRLGAQPTKWPIPSQYNDESNNNGGGDNHYNLLTKDIQCYVGLVTHNGDMVGPPIELRVSCPSNELGFPNCYDKRYNIGTDVIKRLKYAIIQKGDSGQESPSYLGELIEVVTHNLATGRVGQTETKSVIQPISGLHHLLYKREKSGNQTNFTDLLKWLLRN